MTRQCVCSCRSRRRSYATQLPDEDEFQRAIDAAQDEDSEVDESMIDELQILREVEAEEREQELKLKNMQNQAASSFFARIFNRNTPPFPAASSSYSSALQSRPFQRVSSNARRNLRSGRREDDESADGYDEDEETSEVQRPSHKWQQAHAKMRAAGAFGSGSTNQRSTSNAAVVRKDSREDDEGAYVEQGGRGKGRMAQSVSKVMQSGLLRGAGNFKPKPPPPPAVEEEDDDDDLPPPASDDGDDDDWDAPPPMEASGVQTLPPRLQGRGGSYGRSELLDMPPPPDDDDLPPPPDFEDDDPPPLITKSNRHSRRM